VEKVCVRHGRKKKGKCGKKLCNENSKVVGGKRRGPGVNRGQRGKLGEKENGNGEGERCKNEGDKKESQNGELKKGRAVEDWAGKLRATPRKDNSAHETPMQG